MYNKNQSEWLETGWKQNFEFGKNTRLSFHDQKPLITYPIKMHIFFFYFLTWKEATALLYCTMRKSRVTYIQHDMPSPRDGVNASAVLRKMLSETFIFQFGDCFFFICVQCLCRIKCFRFSSSMCNKQQVVFHVSCFEISDPSIRQRR